MNMPAENIESIVRFKTHAEQLWERGFKHVVPLKHAPDGSDNLKVPALGNGWNAPENASGDLDQLQRWVSNQPAKGIGYFVNRGLSAIDIDTPDPAVSGLIAKHIKKHLPGVLTRIGNPNKVMLIARNDDIVEKRTGCFGLELEVFPGAYVEKPTHQFVIYGPHPSGVEYQWDGDEPLNVKFDDIPIYTAEQIFSAVESASNLPEVQAWKKTNVHERLRGLNEDGMSVKTFRDLSKDGVTDDELIAMIDCEGNRHFTAKYLLKYFYEEGDDYDELATKIDEQLKSARGDKYIPNEVANIEKWVEKTSIPYSNPLDDFEVVERGVEIDYVRDKHGNIKPMYNNIRLFLEHESGLNIGFDQFATDIFINGQRLTDQHLLDLRSVLERSLRTGVKPNDVASAVQAVANDNAYDPLRDYFESLPAWDGHDYIAEFSSHLALEQDIELVYVRKHLIACAVRALMPGSKVDTALILFSEEQGKFKSSLIKALSPDETWFTDSPSGHLHSKDELMKLQGKWLIELSELTSLNKGTAENAKQFVSQQVDEFRLPYAKTNLRVPRRYALFGSTNQRQSLSDDTGNRRFWVVDVGGHDRKALDWLYEGDNRDRLWSQAKHLMNSGHQWWLTDEEAAVHASQVLEHKKDSAAVQYVKDWHEHGEGCFEVKGTDDLDRAERLINDPDRLHFVSAPDLGQALKEVLRSPPSPQDLASALKATGWVQYPERKNGSKGTQLNYKENGKTIKAPRGWVSPELHAELQRLNNSDKARALVTEAKFAMF